MNEHDPCESSKHPLSEIAERVSGPAEERRRNTPLQIKALWEAVNDLRERMAALEGRAPDLSAPLGKIEAAADALSSGAQRVGEEAGVSGIDDLAPDPERVEQLRKAFVDASPDQRAALRFGMTDAERKLLTDWFKAEVDEMTNRKMRGEKLNQVDEERYDQYLTAYHTLALKGDGS